MRILLTGSTGFLGRELLARLVFQGHTVYALHRGTPPDLGYPITGDILAGDCLGMASAPKVDAVFHCAAKVDLSNRAKRGVWQTNVEGTWNVLGFCTKNAIERLYYVGTAYAGGNRNPYEISKAKAEDLICTFARIHNLTSTIFKPSIIIRGFFTKQVPQGNAFVRVVAAIAQVHYRAEGARRKIEDTMRLPPLEPVLRISGNPDGELNLVPVDWVASQIVCGLDQEGQVYLVNPHPPTLAQVATWVGDALRLTIRFMPKFTATPPEAVLARLLGPFLPYFQGVKVSRHCYGEAGLTLVNQELVRLIVQRDVLRRLEQSLDHPVASESKVGAV